MVTMRKYLFVLFLILIFASNLCAATVTDSFTGTDSDVGTQWTPYTGHAARRVNNEFQATTEGVYAAEFYNGTTPSDDQYAQITLKSSAPASTTEIGVILRAAADAGTLTGYYCYVSGATDRTVILKKVGGSETPINSETSTTWAIDDVLRCEVTGSSTTTIKVYRNSNLLLTGTDSSSPITSGTFGIYVADTSGFFGAGDDFEGDTATGPPPAVIRRSMPIFFQ